MSRRNHVVSSRLTVKKVRTSLNGDILTPFYSEFNVVCIYDVFENNFKIYIYLKESFGSDVE